MPSRSSSLPVHWRKAEVARVKVRVRVKCRVESGNFSLLFYRAAAERKESISPADQRIWSCGAGFS